METPADFHCGSIAQAAAGAAAEVPALVDSAQRAAQQLRETSTPGSPDLEALMSDFDRVTQELQTALAGLSSAASKVPTAMDSDCASEY